MKLTDHAIWQAGFRPFFTLGCLAGLALPVLWALIYFGVFAAPAGYTRWILLAACCWLGSFALLGWRYIPMLIQPRIDGKVH